MVQRLIGQIRQIITSGTAQGTGGDDRQTVSKPNDTCSLGVMNPAARARQRFIVVDTALPEDNLFILPYVLVALSLIMACGLSLVGCNIGVRDAYAGENDPVTIFDEGPSYTFKFSQGDESIASIISPSTFKDSDGHSYRCINPKKSFKEGAFDPVDVEFIQESERPSAELIHKCALIEYWCTNVRDENPGDQVIQALIWKAIYEMTPSLSSQIDKLSVGGEDLTAVSGEFEAWFDEFGDFYQTSGTYWKSQQRAAQNLMSFHVVPITLSLKKSSAKPEVTQGDANFSLEGAVYKVYSDKDCTQVIESCVLTTTADGTSNQVTLAPGTYFVKEDQAPKGYEQDEQAHEVKIESHPVTLEVTDEPVMPTKDISLTIMKKDADMQEQDGPQGSGTLVGALFEIKCYGEDKTQPLTLTKTTDENGRIEIEPSELRGSSVGKTAYYKSITVQEISAPAGYQLEANEDESTSDEAPLHTFDIESSFEPISLSLVVKDRIKRAGLYVTKADKDLGVTVDENETISHTAKPQGAASLAGITFDVINMNDHPVIVNGRSYPKDATVLTLTTDEHGVAKTDSTDTLPIGTYKVVESKTNSSYKLDSAEPLEVSISEGQAGTYVRGGVIEDTVIRGGLSIAKVSRETSAPEPQAAASLAGAGFAISNANDHPILYENALVEPDELIATIYTDENGIAKTETSALPYGSYYIQEVTAPLGYQLNESWHATATITEDGNLVNVVGDDEELGTSQAPVSDQIIRSDIHFVKRDADTQLPIPYVPFKITSTTTGEWHIMMTDAHGVFDTGANLHSHLTNENDAAYKTGRLDESAMKADAGIWFSGTKPAGMIVSAKDALGALPFDTYTIEELSSSANENKELVSFDVVIDGEKESYDLGTVDNYSLPVPEIHTRLTYGEFSHTIAQGKSYELNDAIEIVNLMPGKTYTIHGYLYPIHENGSLNEDDVIDSHEVDFKATDSVFTYHMPFKVNTTDLGGTRLVACQYLTEGDKTVAIHNSLEDEDQTVYVSTVDTSLSIAKRTSTSNNQGTSNQAGHKITFEDKVSISNLRLDEAYEVTGTLFDKETGKEIADASGNIIHGKAPFVAYAPDTEVSVLFEVDESIVAGRTIVAFEEVCCHDLEVGFHKDINDAKQTVSVPKISTTLSDAEGHHTLNRTETIKLIDTVICTGLEKDQTYRVVGMLMDLSSGRPLKDDSGNTYSSTMTFKADGKSSKSVQVPFNLKSEHLTSEGVVCFEELFIDDTLIASHIDLADENQTVFFPTIETELTDKDHKHEIDPGSSVTLVDKVSYRGLRPNVTYTLQGTLHDASTGSALTSKKSESIQATCTFQPKETSGTAEVTFTFDTSELADKKIVAFEKLFEGTGTDGREIANHADKTDQMQIVSVKSSPTTPDNPKPEDPKTEVPQDDPQQQTPDETDTKPSTTPTDLPTGSDGGSSSTPSTPIGGGSEATPHTGDDSFIAPLAIFVTASILVLSAILVRISDTNEEEQ